MIHLWQRVAHTIHGDMCFRDIRWRVASAILRYSQNSKLNSVAIANHQPKIGTDVLHPAAVKVIPRKFRRL